MPFKSILDLKEEKTSSYTILEWYNCQSGKKEHIAKTQEWMKARLDVPNAIEQSAV